MFPVSILGAGCGVTEFSQRILGPLDFKNWIDLSRYSCCC